MKKFFTSICLLISSLSFAQISILSTDIPRVNDTMRYSETIVGISAAQAAKTGIDTIWDFTNLKAASQDIEKFYAPKGISKALLLEEGQKLAQEWGGECYKVTVA